MRQPNEWRFRTTPGEPLHIGKPDVITAIIVTSLVLHARCEPGGEQP